MWTERSMEGREERVRGLGEVLTGGPRGTGLACQWAREACGARRREHWSGADVRAHSSEDDVHS